MKFWHVARWAGLIVVVLILAVGLARLFSGEEHDQPTVPPSRGDYATRAILPWFILGAAVAGLVAGGVLSARSRVTREALSRDVRFLGAMSIVAATLAGVLAVSLLVALASGLCCGAAEPSNATLFALLGAFGLMGFLALVSAHAYGTKKLLEAHYDLKRTAALLQDTVERLAADADGRHPSTG